MREMIMIFAMLIIFRGVYASEFLIRGRVIDKETGEGIEGAYIGCVGLFEVKRDTPVYIAEMETKVIDSLRHGWLRKKIEEKYKKIPEEVKIEYIFRRKKDDIYGAPKGTFKVEVSTWAVEEIAEYTIGIRRLYGIDCEYPYDSLFNLGDKGFSWLIKLSGRARTGDSGEFSIEEMYAPEKDVVIFSQFSETVSKYYRRKLREMMKDGSIKRCVGLVLQIYGKGYGINDYGIYNEMIARRREVFRGVRKLRGRERYISLEDGRVGKLEGVIGYRWLHFQVPGIRNEEIEGYSIFNGSFPVIEIEIEMGKVKDEEYKMELEEVAYSRRNDKTLENAWSIEGGQASVEEYIEFRDALFKELEGVEEEKYKEKVIKKRNSFGRGGRAFAIEIEDRTKEGVIIEEYVPEVIIEGKWGAGEGEFGRQIHPDAPAVNRIYQPSSLAVDSRGNIYILDVVNNRIQKFDKDGRYLKSIPVESFKGEIGVWEYKIKGREYPYVTNSKEKPEVKGKTEYIRPIIYPDKVLGINIVIDSRDNLYYYCIRGDKGEVWWFKGDELAKKWEVPASEFGMHIDRNDGEIYISRWNIKRNTKREKKLDEPLQKLIRKDIRGNRIKPFGIIKREGGDIFSEGIEIETEDGRKVKLERKRGEWFSIGSERITSKGEIYTVVKDEGGKLWHYKYNFEGRLESVALPPKPEGKGKSDFYIRNKFSSFKESGDILQMKIDKTEGIKVIKWHRKAVR